MVGCPLAGFLLVDGSESNPWYGAPSIELIRPLGAENDITAKAEPTTISATAPSLLVKVTMMKKAMSKRRKC